MNPNATTFMGLLVIIVFGVMLANAIANPTGTRVLVDGFANFWKTSVNGLLGKTS